MKTEEQHAEEIHAELTDKMGAVESVWHGQVLADALVPRLARLEAERERQGAAVAALAASVAALEGGTAKS